MLKNKKVENKLKNIPELQPKHANVIETLKTLKEESKSEKTKIKISFQFFERNNKLFNLGEVESEWFIKVIDTLQLLSQITRKQLFGEYKEKFKPHPYNDIDKLNLKDDMLTNQQNEAYQIRITKSKGRLHGFFVENIYYIRFIDRWHNMYNDVKYGGITIKMFPDSMYDILEDKYKELEEKNIKLEKQLNNNFNALCNNCSDCQKSEKIYKSFYNL